MTENRFATIKPSELNVVRLQCKSCGITAEIELTNDESVKQLKQQCGFCNAIIHADSTHPVQRLKLLLHELANDKQYQVEFSISRNEK